ncbi:hypothetical protein KIN20_020146 [Parelaphostrongylus tenuis]|uniref:Uncharacterized protein n=1 Tax=Parelaphostrongylus tenuis TaxID=148309 RepID=A0AAD5N5M8_PARTN|nr:hypothetical protein KIN20_020146 [Parelaphostrongylus tenuis]
MTKKLSVNLSITCVYTKKDLCPNVELPEEQVANGRKVKRKLYESENIPKGQLPTPCCTYNDTLEMTVPLLACLKGTHHLFESASRISLHYFEVLFYVE